ncbi:MAG: GNAT family N-acetyltransferase [Actinomycetales bacterium]|nr:GNAT family N-acetyltransferase [Actinomycetales bacterium]
MPWLPVLHDGTEDLAFFGAQLGEGSSWGAVVHGALVGFAIRHDDWLRHLYVDPRHQRRGIGSALLERVIAEAADGLQLWAFARNTPAIAFYRGHGFEVAERTDGAGNEEREPDVRMTRR